MTTYTVYFRTSRNYADHDIEADTPEQALALGRQLASSGDIYHEAFFDDYEGRSPINEIEVCEDGESAALWQDDDLALRNAAAQLLDALEVLVERDRAEAASCGLENDEMTWLEDARRAIALAKGGAA